MKYGIYKTFNLEKKRPKVLLMGNGLTYSSSISWNELIRKVSRKDVDISKYETLRHDGDKSVSSFSIPYTILTMVTADVDDNERHSKYRDVLSCQEYNKTPLLEGLLDIPFDAILTTNYTYEIESIYKPGYQKLSSEGKRRYSFCTEKKEDADNKFLIHTYNRIKENSSDIWHIHGELRRPSSMLLSHDEYARYVYQILLHNKKTADAYEKDHTELKMRSWIDYLLMGDVYILGLGLDFSEFDLWWLLGRRQREKAKCGSIIFYEPEKDDCRNKILALNGIGVETRSFGMRIEESNSYDRFYERAIEDIKTTIDK